MISLVGGVMLGIAVFHMIPHSVAAIGPKSIDQVTAGLMFGLLTTFFLLRFFHFHQHEPATHSCAGETHAIEGAHDHSHSPLGKSESPRWIGVLAGLGLHTMLDGMALAASVEAEWAHDSTTWLAGIGTFIAVLLHKPLDAVSITSLLPRSTGQSRRLLINVGFALMCPLGAVLFWGGVNTAGDWASPLSGWALAFSAGVFLCISLSDLLPEMEFHSHNRVKLSCALLLGILVAWAIGLAEGHHAHSHVEAEHAHEIPHENGHAH